MQKKEPLLRHMLKKMHIIKRKPEPVPSEKPPIPKKEQQQLNSQLLDAVVFGDNAQITRLITKGADVATKGCTGKTPLHLAAANGHTWTCALLLERYAEQGGDVKKLLEEKAKEPFSWGGKTALGIVINSSPKETATLLESMEWLAKQPNTLNPFLADFGRCVGH